LPSTNQQEIALHYLLAINNAMGRPISLPMIPEREPLRLPRRPNASPPMLAALTYGSNEKRNKLLQLPVGQLPTYPINESTWCQNNLLRFYRTKRSVNLT